MANDQHLQLLLQMMTDGYLVVDSKGLCTKTYSQSCHHLFDFESLHQQPLSHILNIEKSQLNVFDKWIELLFKKGSPAKNLMSFAPKLMKSRHQLDLSLSYELLVEDKSVVGLAVMAKDISELITEKRRVEIISNNSKKLKSVMTSFYDFKRFRSFHYEILNRLRQEHKSILDAYELHQDIHSLKGLASVFNFKHFAKTIDQIENRIRGKLSKVDINVISMEIEEALENSFLRELEGINDTLQALDANDSFCDVSFSDAINLLYESKDNKHIAQPLYDILICEPFERKMSSFGNELQRLAHVTNKKLYPLEIEGDVNIPPLIYDKFFQTFIHLFRNIVDHGIELPSDRKLLGKNENGQVTVSAQLDSQMVNLEIRVRDDGGGIDPDKIRKKMKEDGDENESIDMSDQEVIQQIFYSKFSTSKVVNSLSGFGLGVCAVKFEVEKLGGTIRVESKVNSYCEFVITIPYQNYDAFLNDELKQAS